MEDNHNGRLLQCKKHEYKTESMEDKTKSMEDELDERQHQLKKCCPFIIVSGPGKEHFFQYPMHNISSTKSVF